MLRSVAGRAKALPIDQPKFDWILDSIWWKSGNHPRLGLAISGGVDSMALASLCSKTSVLGKNKPSFTAFIVDHRLRRGSDVEAEKVARVLEQINIDTQILKLDWSGITDRPDQIENLESIARRLRFQALGKACRDSNILSLLLAHHGDDQAETVLSRLVTGYTGAGFRGIQAESNIPECHGIYGVCESGSPHLLRAATLGGTLASPLLIEKGGVRVYRPLLGFSKAMLIATCEHNNVRWFEDPTNADRGLTLRNTIRHIWSHTQPPQALSPEAMLRMAERVDERAETREQAAQFLFNNCNIDLDVRSGSLTLLLPSDLKDQLSGIERQSDLKHDADYILALLLRKILVLVTPKQAISLQELDGLSSMIMQPPPADGKSGRSTLAVAGLSVTRLANATSGVTGQLINDTQVLHKQSESTESLQNSLAKMEVYRIEREILKLHHLGSKTQTVIAASHKRASSTDFAWTEWKLFDSRFWIRLRYRPFNLTPGRSVIVRFFSRKDIEALHKSMSPLAVASLDRTLRESAPGKSRFTLPVILERYDVTSNDGKSSIREDICALPSIGWSNLGWRAVSSDDGTEESDRDGVSWSWECRYKMIEFGTGSGHSIKEALPIRSQPRRRSKS